MPPDLVPSDPSPQPFATTRWSLILDAGAGDSPTAMAALEELCRGYWVPIYAYVCRSGVAPDAAKDLTQQFFATLLEKQWLVRADRDRGRFRSFLLTYLKRFLSDERDRTAAKKRGGGKEILSLDELGSEEAAGFEPSAARTPECEYDRQWALSTLQNALTRLRAEAAASGAVELFEAVQGHLSHDDTSESLGAVARRFGLGESAVKMRLKRWRDRYQDLIRFEVAQTVPRIADVNEELRHLMAALMD
ncbi:MAG: sigma-70 family RNA polymerase sigma factor [Verrucomicrobiales bacterium]|nr:sigma-70 family RNA polymerase sigma factor [Verrucomicrobiales bacterium]